MIGKRQNNRRTYPDAGMQPCQKSKYRREEALERQAAYDALTLQEKIARLPPEPFSAKQRKKLIAQLNKLQVDNLLVVQNKASV